MPLTDSVQITAEDAADYLGIPEPTTGQLKALDRLSRSAVEHCGLYLNRGFSGEDETVPAAVEEACYRMLRALYDRRENRLVKSEHVLQATETYDTSRYSGSIPPEVEDLLRAYRFVPGL